MVTDFEKYDDLYPGAGTGADIRAAVVGPAAHTATLIALRDDLDTESTVANGQVQGTPAPIAQTPAQASTLLDITARNGTYAIGLLNQFAGVVDTFDAAVDGLNTQLHNAPAAERADRKQELHPDWTTAFTTLEEGAELTGDDFNAGPSAAKIRELVLDGFLDLGTTGVWGDLGLSEEQAAEARGRREAIAAMDAMRGLPVADQAHYVLDHPELALAVPYLPVEIREEAGRQIAAGVDDRGIASQSTWDDLEAFALDTEMTGAFVDALGAQQMALFVANRNMTLDADGNVVEADDDEAHSRYVTAGYAMAGASHDGVIDRDFLQYFNANYTGVGMDAQVLGDLMQYGDWDPGALQTIGNYALDGGVEPGGPAEMADGVAHLLKGVSYNPEAAAELYGERFDDLVAIGADPYTGTDAGSADIADFIVASTVTADSHYQLLQLDDPHASNVAQENTLRLLEWQAANEDVHMSSDVQGAYARILGHYMDDVTASVTSPVPTYFEQSDPDRDGIEAPDDLWAALMQEGMRNPDVAGGLSVDFKNEIQSMVDAAETQDGPENSNNFSIAQAGHLEDWFVSNFQQTVAEVGDEVDDYNGRVDAAIQYAYDYAMATGSSAATGSPVPLIKEISGDVVGLLGNFLHQEVPDYSEVDTSWASNFSETWQSTVGNKLEAGLIEPVTVDGITWEGDPAFYEDLYHGDFTNPDGSIMSVADMDSDAQRAYTEWLNDPAVQNAAYDDWAARQVGTIPSPSS